MGGESGSERGGDEDQDGWLTLAAARLGRSVDTLRMQRCLGALQAEKRAGVWLTRPAWVAA